jgi:hypothetical protein
MQAVYTYRIRVDGVTHLEPCNNLWDALNRAAYDLTEQQDTVEPVFIAVGECIFTSEQIPVLLAVAHRGRREQPRPALAF